MRALAIFLCFLGTAASAQERLPIIDVHMHALPANDQGPPPVAICTPMPMPAWDLVDVARYRDLWSRHHGYFSMNMVTTRGCPYHCNWCAKPLWGQRYAIRSPENVVDELEQLVRDGGSSLPPGR